MLYSVHCMVCAPDIVAGDDEPCTACNSSTKITPAQYTLLAAWALQIVEKPCTYDKYRDLNV